MKKSYQDNFRVVIEPRRLGNFGSVSVPDNFFGQTEERIRKDYKDRCEEIASEAKRHVDNIGSVYIDSDTVSVCEFCGSTWSEDSDLYNGGCCEKDEENSNLIENT